MSALMKKLSDADKTTEVEIPESIKQSAQKIKKEHDEIHNELEKAKSEEVIRKTDESTKVFNLRQHMAIEKIKELEQRKVKAEREINALMQQKNSKLHEELKKVTDVLVCETKKIIPLEKEFELRLSKISNLKTEMQHFFESSLDERKKNSHFIENQTKEINQVGSLVKETLIILQKDVHQVSAELEKLTQQKLELLSYLSQLKEEVFLKEGVLRLCENKKNETIQLDAEIEGLKVRLSDLRELGLKHGQLQSEIIILQSQLQDSKIKVDSSLQEMSEAKSQKIKLQFGLEQLEHEFESRRGHLTLLEKDVLNQRILLENLKNEEAQLNQTIKEKQNELSKNQAEISHSSAQKEAFLKMLEEVGQFYHQKKDVFLREMDLLDQNFESKRLQYEAEFEMKKTSWDLEFKKFTEQRESEQKLKLIQLEQQEREEVGRKRAEFHSLVMECFKRQFEKDDFVSVDQKINGMRKDVESVFERFFGRQTSKKFW
jgi:chromosome segregation ATPase